MAQVTFKGGPVQTSGTLPAVGAAAPAFTLTNAELGEASLSDFTGQKVVLNIFPSIDTGVCAASVRKFNAEAGSHPNAKVLCISADLPFAQSRFCGAEGLSSVVTLSDFRNREFGDAYGVRIAGGPLGGLLARAVVVVDEQGKVIHTELVPEITQEPNYDAALQNV